VRRPAHGHLGSRRAPWLGVSGERPYLAARSRAPCTPDRCPSGGRCSSAVIASLFRLKVTTPSTRPMTAFGVAV
jgi:hypothetical protein